MKDWIEADEVNLLPYVDRPHTIMWLGHLLLNQPKHLLLFCMLLSWSQHALTSVALCSHVTCCPSVRGWENALWAQLSGEFSPNSIEASVNHW